jgi:hypothetical protein
LNKNINNASWVLALPDGLEEARTLSILEKNFHKIVKAYLGKLFQAKHTYWRQRATIRFVKFGDETSKCFMSWPLIPIGKNIYLNYSCLRVNV